MRQRREVTDREGRSELLQRDRWRRGLGHPAIVLPRPLPVRCGPRQQSDDRVRGTRAVTLTVDRRPVVMWSTCRLSKPCSRHRSAKATACASVQPWPATRARRSTCCRSMATKRPPGSSARRYCFERGIEIGPVVHVAIAHTTVAESSETGRASATPLTKRTFRRGRVSNPRHPQHDGRGIHARDNRTDAAPHAELRRRAHSRVDDDVTGNEIAELRRQPGVAVRPTTMLSAATSPEMPENPPNGRDGWGQRRVRSSRHLDS